MRDGSGRERASDHRLHPLIERVLRQGADLGRGDLAVLEQHQSGDAAHAVTAGRLGVVVDVGLAFTIMIGAALILFGAALTMLNRGMGVRE